MLLGLKWPDYSLNPSSIELISSKTTLEYWLGPEIIPEFLPDEFSGTQYLSSI